MKWKKPSEKMIVFFDSILPSSSKVVRKKMFGCSVGFINGNMFMGLHSDGIILRLGEGERENFIKQYNAKIFEPNDPAGRLYKIGNIESCRLKECDYSSYSYYFVTIYTKNRGCFLVIII